MTRRYKVTLRVEGLPKTMYVFAEDKYEAMTIAGNRISHNDYVICDAEIA